MPSARVVGRAVGLAAAVLAAGALEAAMAPPKDTPLAQREFRHPQLQVTQSLARVEEQPPAARGPWLDALAELRVSSSLASIDTRTGRFATLIPAHPLLPGTGEGNRIAWQDLGAPAPADANGWKEAAWEAFAAYVRAHAGALGVDPAELASPGLVTVHDGGSLVQVHAPRVFRGVPVRDSALSAVVSHGNLVLLGAHNWGAIELDSRPGIAADAAAQALARHVPATPPSGQRRAPALAIVPVATPLSTAGPGRGLAYRLVWVLSPRFSGDPGTWEALVDAHSGELLAFTDTNQYQSARRVQGGVYPVSNDQNPPDGIEQAGWPFPFADVATSGGSFFTDTGGNLPVCAAGAISSTLSGRYVRINDTCGPVALSSSGNLDFGVSAGTNCTTPGLGGAGNTHAARTAFHELNKVMEHARGQLPGNAWLQQQITANTNVNLTCGAFWNGFSLTTYREGSGCANVGEIASIFDHEWGHGMDDNDANGSISNPGEAIADIYAALRLDQSCIGRGVRTVNCTGYGNPCLACTGVRELDWDKRALHQPTTVTWINANCGSGPGPCGGIVHCEGAVYSEAIWDLFNRDLPGTMGMSADTALEVATRTTYLGAGPVGTVFTCNQGSGGCAATGAYLNFLAADDDNGNIADGTPHMGAIFAAFDRHGIACPAPAPVTSGCPNAPVDPPIGIIAVAEDKGARISWVPVGGAAAYRVYRTEGVHGCAFGKVLLGETPYPSWSDTGLQNGRTYYYTVAAVGLAPTCLGPMSACTPVTPAAGVNLTADLSAVATTITSGDGDAFIDNCESVTVRVPVANTGTGPQTNVRVVAAQPLSHLGMEVTGFAGGVALAPCASSSVPAFSFRAVDLASGDVIRFRVDVTSDELSPSVRSFVVALVNATEGDNQFFASRTFTFETDAEGWQPFEGTFARTSAAPGGSGGPGTFYFQSSSFLDAQCDEVRSPILSLTPTSTLSLQDNFDIEGPSGGSWYDRANLGVVPNATGARTVVAPDGGRTYNAVGGGFTSCGMSGQSGWGGPNPTWAPSTWTAAALGSATVADQPIRLSLRYGTDGALSGAGFRLDTVTVTDVNSMLPDTQGDQCTPGNQVPVANPDLSSTTMLGPVTITVLDNDSDPDPGQCLRVVAVTQPANGTAMVESWYCVNQDRVRYVPNVTCGPPCVDSFQYVVSDQNGGLASATVTIHQVPVELQGFRVE